MGVTAVFWWVLAANCLQVMAFMGCRALGTVSHADLPSERRGDGPATGHWDLGVIMKSCWEGGWRGQAYRLAVVALVFLGGGAAPLVFTADLSPWATVVLACSVVRLVVCSLASDADAADGTGQSRATATGLYAVGNNRGSGRCLLRRCTVGPGGFLWWACFAWQPLRRRQE